jgi:CHAT domain-containing protein
MYSAQARYEEALSAYEQALTIRREIGDREGEGVTLSNLGLMYQRQGHYLEGLDIYQRALTVFEAIRAMAGSEQGRTSFIAQYADLYTNAVSLFHQQNQPEQAFLTAERGRARAFLDAMATGYVQLSDDDSADLLAQEQETYAQRQAAQDALAKAKALPSTGSGQAPPDPQLVADLEVQLAEAEQAYAEAQAAIEARGDQLADLIPGRKKVLGVQEVQALLDEQTTLISYFILDDQTLAFLLTHDSFQVIELDLSREALADRVADFRNAIEQAPDLTPSLAQQLYKSLLTPLSSHLTTPHLAIVPHGSLHYLPFAALQNPETEQYLIQDYVLTTLPNASVLPFVTADRRPPTAHPPLIVGNPTTGDFDAVASLAIERGGLSPLPFAEKEAQSIAKLFGVEPLLGQAATEGTVREQATGAGVVHLAAHGYYNAKAPLSSLIALAPDPDSVDNSPFTIDNSQLADGWLTVGEVYGLDLSQTGLVVLSACQTQLGELSAGDEVVGLTRAFFFAKTPTVVASLWNVDDEATAFLMERFYTHLRAGMGKAEALRQAQIETMVEYPEPFYWAAFVMSGDGGEVSEEAAFRQAQDAGLESGQENSPVPSDSTVFPWSWLWLVVVIAVVVVGMAWWRRRKHSASVGH